MLDAILGAPAIVKALGALSLILLINGLCRRLLVAVLAGALALALWCGHSPAAAAHIAWVRLSSTSNLLLLLVVFQVLWLSSQMAATGVMTELVEAVRARVSRRGAMAVLPAVIGLLPMPGGALFSAPMVDSCDPEGEVVPGLKAQTNHWFRHVWEYWWPLYPGVLLALEITGLDLWQVMLYGVPLSLASACAGYVFLLRRIPHEQAAAPAQSGRPARPLLPLLTPIAVVIGAYVFIKGGHALLSDVAPQVGPLNRYVPMALGLFCAMAVLQRSRPLGLSEWKRIALSRRALSMAVIVAAVRVYGAFVEADLPGGESLVGQMHVELSAWGIPAAAIIAVLPLVSGLAMGLSVGFVGASFPIVLSLLGADVSFGQALSAWALAYGFGYMGMLLSPVHVCLVVTSKHFETPVLRNAAGMLPAAALVCVCTLALHLLFPLLLP